MGWDTKAVLILEDGAIVEFDQSRHLVFGRKKIPMDNLAVDGNGIGTLQSRTMKDRIQM